VTPTVSPGDRVEVDYVGRFEDGTVFATTDPDVAADHGLADDPDRAPLSFVVGAGEVIPGLDDAVVGTTPGETTTVTVPPAEAYGAHDPEKVREYDAETFEAMVDAPPRVGDHVEAANGRHGDVVAVADGVVRVDFNHELAGRTLVLDVRVRAVG
jgi:peptidyl-prolyl cis-trans isomerase B (cyclophilin B)